MEALDAELFSNIWLPGDLVTHLEKEEGRAGAVQSVYMHIPIPWGQYRSFKHMLLVLWKVHGCLDANTYHGLKEDGISSWSLWK